MRPLAMTTAASACDGGPMIAIDLPGADPKVRATTIVNQPQATSTIAPVILPNGRSLDERGLPSIVIEVLDAGAPGLELPADIDQTIDPSLKTNPAEAGPGVEIER